MTELPPGATIGILGGGQLGRMIAMAVGNCRAVPIPRSSRSATSPVNSGSSSMRSTRTRPVSPAVAAALTARPGPRAGPCPA